MDLPGAYLEMLDEEFYLVLYQDSRWIIHLHTGLVNVSHLPDGEASASRWLEEMELDQILVRKRGCPLIGGKYIPLDLALPFVWNCYRTFYSSLYGVSQVHHRVDYYYQQRHMDRRSDEGRPDRLVVIRLTEEPSVDYYQYRVYYCTEESSFALLHRVRKRYPEAMRMWTILHYDPMDYWDRCTAILYLSIEAKDEHFDLCERYTLQRLELDMIQIAGLEQN